MYVIIIKCNKDNKKIELFQEIKRKYSDNIFLINTIVFLKIIWGIINQNIDVKIIVIVYIFLAYNYLLKGKLVIYIWK